MAATDTALVLAELAGLATERDWAPVTDFVESLPDAGDQSVLVLAAADVDDTPLAEWISSLLPGTFVTTGPLEALNADPGPGLTANRVLAVFQCGRLLLPDGLAAAAEVLARPADSFAIVLVGAEVIADQTDLGLIERAVWRVLIGDPDVQWAGQDLAAHRCLLWTDSPPPGWPPELAGRLDHDVDLLASWLRTPAAASEGLARSRARHALGIAEHAASRRPERAERPSGRSEGLAVARAAVERLREQLLSHLDADAAALEREVSASLRMLEQDLLSGVDLFLDWRAGNLASAQDLRSAVADYLSRGLDDWWTHAAVAIARRGRLTDARSGDLLGDVDWDLVNQAAPHPEGLAYPEAIGRRLRLDIDMRPPVYGHGVLDDVGSPPPEALAEGWTGSLRTAALSGALAVAVTIVLGPAILPAVALGAAGAASGGLADHYTGAARTRRAAQAYTRLAVTQVLGQLLGSVRGQLRGTAAATHRAVDADFRALAHGLLAAAGREPQEAGSAPRFADLTRLADLGRRLAEDTRRESHKPDIDR